MSLRIYCLMALLYRSLHMALLEIAVRLCPPTRRRLNLSASGPSYSAATTQPHDAFALDPFHLIATVEVGMKDSKCCRWAVFHAYTSRAAWASAIEN
ncbi:uncharacterized protein F5147DRAFT_335998 [Suillus discolor]|uniref:Secreted protein n=1 Tax=Suillus discolor TaxID=1912936 RepID=A0A9P7EZF5_9AGAM|nr:uncharacterized protein F5147DRAFT_335998 [Suillus discolor]KAG2099587.1 hypothetical protein F5147DRAFT_335998 [Suillus discolor]